MIEWIRTVIHVIVRRQDAASNGEIVVALLEDEATVKRFYRENDHVRRTENRFMEPIITLFRHPGQGHRLVPAPAVTLRAPVRGSDHPRRGPLSSRPGTR